MRAKCPKCGNVFEVKPGLSLVHVGPYRRIECPACGKKSMMNNFVKDPITWPPEERENKEELLTKEELMKKRIDESKYEDTEK